MGARDGVGGRIALGPCCAGGWSMAVCSAWLLNEHLERACKQSQNIDKDQHSALLCSQSDKGVLLRSLMRCPRMRLT